MECLAALAVTIGHQISLHVARGEWARAHEVLRRAQADLANRDGTPVLERRIHDIDPDPLNTEADGRQSFQRLATILERAGIVTMDQLLEQSDDDLLGLRGMGQTGLELIDRAVAACGQVRRKSR